MSKKLKISTAFLISVLITNFLFTSNVFAISKIAQKEIYKYNQFDPIQKSSDAKRTRVPAEKQYLVGKLINPRTVNNKCTTGGCPYITFDTLLTQSSYVTTGDIDNDGRNEVISSSFYDGYIAILHQNSKMNDLSLIARWDINTEPGSSINGASEVLVADVNSDSKRDIIVVDAFNTKVFAFLQTDQIGVYTKVTLINFTDYYLINSANVGDFNNDGKTDIALTAYDKAYIFTNQNGVFVKTNTFNAGFGLYDEPAIADVNGDGHSDLIVADGYKNKLYIWNSPNFNLIQIDSPGNVASNLSIGDLDNDGVNDIAVSGGGTNNIKVTWGKDFTTTDLHATGNNVNMNDLAIGKLSGSTNNTLVATSSSDYTLHKWRFSDRNTAYESLEDSYVSPGQVVINDVSNDGENDILYGLSGHTSPPHAPISVHFSSLVSTPKPDMQVVNGFYTNSKNNTLLPEVEINLTLRNNGNSIASSFILRIVVQQINGVVTKDMVIKNLYPGEIRIIKKLISIPRLSNINSVISSVDPDGQVSETNENNNVLELQYQR